VKTSQSSFVGAGHHPLCPVRVKGPGENSAPETLASSPKTLRVLQGKSPIWVMEFNVTVRHPCLDIQSRQETTVMKSTGVALALAFCTAVAGTSVAAAQFDLARHRKCTPVWTDWDKANKSGDPGRRKALKVVLDSAKVDPVIADCFSEKIMTDLRNIARKSSVQEGWAAVLKTNTYNFNAAKSQAPSDQCPASKLVIAGWNAFYADRKDISAIVDTSAQKKHKALCG
jgi:hypothetical protein